MEPLIEDLENLWHGIEVYDDVSKPMEQHTFNLRGIFNAWLPRVWWFDRYDTIYLTCNLTQFMQINFFLLQVLIAWKLLLGSLLVNTMYAQFVDTIRISLLPCDPQGYIWEAHCRYLLDDHPMRDGLMGMRPQPLKANDCSRMWKNILGRDPPLGICTLSIFHHLPYWPSLLINHLFDPMPIFKNVGGTIWQHMTCMKL